jgi:transcriptional regulator with XRE-family HTH domain
MNQRISARIRLERESRGWSLSELADRAGVSRAMIHKIERGDSSPTATLLARLSGAFGISMSTLIARAEMQEGKLCALPSARLARPADALSPPPCFSPYRSAHRPCSGNCLRAAMPMPASSYALARQLIWLQSGELVFQEGDTRHEMQAGDCLELGPPNDCRFINETNESCVYLVVRLNQSGS